MFIRSQNKEMLINANNIRIISDSRSYDIICDFYDGYYYYLGEYSTKEKAFLVLDMIEKVAMYPGNSLFQMPQDDEAGLWN